LGYISVAESLSTSSTTFTQCMVEGYRSRWNNAKNDHYAVQGHSRSPIL